MSTREEILAALFKIEADEGVRILYACESGSRAWGFESQDSDYDVRFVYARPLDWYLSLQPGSDVIERPLMGDLDLSGWDLRKALQLFRKSNPPLLEWLGSPTIYLERGVLGTRLREMARIYCSPVAIAHHYLAMARGNYKDYLTSDTIRHKKYLYVLRPLLAARWVDSEFGPPPTEFRKLVERLIKDPDALHSIDELLAAKQRSGEMDSGLRIDAISGWIEAEMERWAAEGVRISAGSSRNAPLDELFREILRERSV